MSVWLRDIVGLPQYIDCFVDEAVMDFETVKSCNKQDLREIGITKLGHIKRILNCIEEL